MKPKTEIAHITTPVAKYTLDFNTGVIKAKPIITHGDSIRSMTDEELAGILAMQSLVSPPWCTQNYDCPYADQDPVRCDLCALDWLKQEADDAANL